MYGLKDYIYDVEYAFSVAAKFWSRLFKRFRRKTLEHRYYHYKINNVD